MRLSVMRCVIAGNLLIHCGIFVNMTCINIWLINQEIVALIISAACLRQIVWENWLLWCITCIRLFEVMSFNALTILACFLLPTYILYMCVIASRLPKCLVNQNHLKIWHKATPTIQLSYSKLLKVALLSEEKSKSPNLTPMQIWRVLIWLHLKTG